MIYHRRGCRRDKEEESTIVEFCGTQNALSFIDNVVIFCLAGEGWRTSSKYFGEYFVIYQSKTEKKGNSISLLITEEKVRGEEYIHTESPIDEPTDEKKDAWTEDADSTC